MKCPNDFCNGVLEVHETDYGIESYCLDGCGYEEKIKYDKPHFRPPKKHERKKDSL